MASLEQTTRVAADDFSLGDPETFCSDIETYVFLLDEDRHWDISRSGFVQCFSGCYVIVISMGSS